jgi:hypothetical protein
MNRNNQKYIGLLLFKKKALGKQKRAAKNSKYTILTLLSLVAFI